MLVVLVLQLELDAAHGVDLINGNLGTVLGRIAVDGGAAGQGAGAAQLEGGAGGSGGLLGGAARAFGGGFFGFAAAAGSQAEDHDHGHHETHKLLFHCEFSFCKLK